MNLVFGSKVALLGFWDYMSRILMTVRVRGGRGSIPGTELELSMESVNKYTIYRLPYCKLSNALEELGYK
jgi:hypothetical protein